MLSAALKPKLKVFVLFAALALCATARAQKQFVVIDTDIGDDIDDAFAVSLALRSPEFRVLAITTGFGDTVLRAHLVAHLLEDAHAAGIPIAAGVPTSVKAKFTQRPYAEADRHEISSEPAVDLILSQARKHPGQVTLLALGPLVNVGAAIDRDPSTFRKFKRVVVMGGSIDEGYNDGSGEAKPPSAEWNIVNDPVSARKLLASGVPIYLMPLDSTQVPLSAALQSQIAARHDPLSAALTELTHEANKPKPVLYDPATVAFAAVPSLCTTQPMHIEIDDKGFTRQTPGPPNANVCLKSDEAAILQLFTERLGGPAR